MPSCVRTYVVWADKSPVIHALNEHIFQSPRAMSPTHRLPRPYVKPKAGGEFMNPATAGSFSNSEDERNSPRSRSRLSTSYSAGESSI